VMMKTRIEAIIEQTIIHNSLRSDST